MRDRREILNDYLLGELPDEQRAELLREIEADPQLSTELAELSPLVATLEDLPAEAWDHVEAPPLRLNGVASEPPAPARETARRSRIKDFFSGSFALRPALAFAAVLAIFVAGFGVGMLSGGDNSTTTFGPVATQASLSPVGELDPAATGKATVKQDGQTIRLKISGLAVNGESDFYEAWLMDPKDGFISLGTFRVGNDGSTTLDLPVAVSTDRFPVVDISLQPTNGKPTHSGVSVLRGTLN
ncbi:MAG: anti-sigma factor [Thermoleophilaceae bacterium]|nr:anti-sigma factor [Thermoleophilaceae bacterium]